MKVKISEITIPDRKVDRKKIKNMKMSLAFGGQKDPIVVRRIKAKAGKNYSVKDGLHRLLAAKELGLELIEVEVQ